MKSARLVVLGVAATLASTHLAFALEEWIVVPHVSDVQRRTTRQQYLDELISSIQSACELTRAETRRLQVASKGAVEYSCQVEDEEGRPNRLRVGWANIQQDGRQVVVSAEDAAAAARHPIWTKTLERMLTHQQLSTVNRLTNQQFADWQQRLGRQRVMWGFEPDGGLRRVWIRRPVKQNALKVAPARRLDVTIEPRAEQ